MLAFAKDLPGTWDRQHRRVWEHRDTERVAGTTALIVGVGPIGRAVARLLRAVGVQVSGVGRTARDGDPDFGTVAASADLTRLLPDADHVVLAAPLTEQTRGMVGAPELAATRPSARLINVGRGELVVEADLVEALRAGRIGGAALDVFEREPPHQPRWTSWTPFSYPFNLTQQPAVSVPCGRTAGGLPVGLQIVGPRHADMRVLAAAKAYEDARERA